MSGLLIKPKKYKKNPKFQKEKKEEKMPEGQRKTFA